MFVSGIELRFLVRHVRRLNTKRYNRERRKGINAEVTTEEGRTEKMVNAGCPFYGVREHDDCRGISRKTQALSAITYPCGTVLRTVYHIWNPLL